MDIKWIREKLKMLATSLKHNEPAFITLEMVDEYVENQNVQLNEFKADLLEMARHIEREAEDKNYYCCDAFYYGFMGKHEESCVVSKAEKIIKELENE